MIDIIVTRHQGLVDYLKEVGLADDATSHALAPMVDRLARLIGTRRDETLAPAGLAAWLLGLRHEEQVHRDPLWGALFENMVVAEFHKQMHHRYRDESPWFWRDNHGNEIDLLVDQGINLDAYEIKASETILTENFNGLAKFEQIASSPLRIKGLIYAGDLNQKRSAGQVISWKDFPGF
jgi:hypothetical protein